MVTSGVYGPYLKIVWYNPQAVLDIPRSDAGTAQVRSSGLTRSCNLALGRYVVVKITWDVEYILNYAFQWPAAAVQCISSELLSNHLAVGLVLRRAVL